MGVWKQNMKTKFRLMVGGVAAGLALALGAPPAQGQSIALSVGNNAPVTNALGRSFQGVNGYPEISSRVEIRQTWTGGQILSPTNAAGDLDAFNPLVRASYIGQNAVANSGMFAENFYPDRLPTNVTYYVRAFDAPSADAAIYYADSATFTVPSETTPAVDVSFGGLKLVATGAPDGDADGDGIPDMMESDMSLDPNNPDTDGDGFADRFEELNDYVDPREYRPLDVDIRAPQAAADPHVVSWWTIPGVGYRLEYWLEWSNAAPRITNFWNTTGAGTEIETLEVDVDDFVTDSPVKGFFRVFAIP